MDTIVVGAGTAGAAVAGRLAAGSAESTLLLEAGPTGRLTAADGRATSSRLVGDQRSGRLSRRGANDAFEAARDAAGLPAELDLHSLRHSMITHVVEFGYPERFAQDQAGHVVASTTAIYTGVSDEFRNRLLKATLAGRYPGLWEDSAP